MWQSPVAMVRSSENRCFRRCQQTRDPRLLAPVFDAAAN